jgi:hypothetical protein
MSTALETTLALLRPSEDETLLLRACLHDGSSARDGWRAWRARRPGPDTALCEALAEWRTLLPLLARSSACDDHEMSPGLRQHLRAATLREDVRAARYRKITAETLEALAADGVVPFVVRGAALAATIYDDASLRHCHDLDLLVDPAELEIARRALARAGYTAGASSRRDAIALHASGLAVALHTQPFAIAHPRADDTVFARGARVVDLWGAPARLPSPEAMFVHGIGHAGYSASRRNLRWVSDAWHLLARHREVDWEDVLERLASHRIDLPAAVLIGYLAELGALVPGSVRAQLNERAQRADRVAEDVALAGLTSGSSGDVAGIWRAARSWSERARLARFAVVPTPAYMRSDWDADDWLLALCYVYRPARFVASRVARRMRRSAVRTQGGAR